MKKIGIIGCGARMQGVATAVVQAADGQVAVAAVHDISPYAIEQATQQFPQADIMDSVAAITGRADLDWIFVGSFNAAHAEHTVAALEGGKHVFCEKPLATTKEDCLAIGAACQRNPTRHFAIGFVLRYSPFYRKMYQLLTDGRIGDIISLEFNETTDPNHGAAMHGNWRRDVKKGGNLLLEKCCHDIDLLHWLTASRPRRVASFGGLNFFTAKNAHYIEQYPPNSEGVLYYEIGLRTGRYVGREENISPFNDDKSVIDNQVAILELENGIRASFHFCTHAVLRERRFYICGTEGTLRGDVITGELELQAAGWDEPVQRYKPIAGESHGQGDKVLAAELARCILEGVPLSTTFESAITAAFTCFGIDDALQSGSVIDMAPYWLALQDVILS